MKQNSLLENEKIIITSGDGSATLSNFRIQYSDKKWGKAYTLSMLLKNISTVEINYKSNRLLLIIAGLIFFGGLIIGEQLFISTTISVLLTLFFLITRRHYITIASNGGARMNLLVKGMKSKNVLNFLNQIEQAVINNEAINNNVKE